MSKASPPATAAIYGKFFFKKLFALFEVDEVLVVLGEAPLSDGVDVGCG